MHIFSHLLPSGIPLHWALLKLPEFVINYQCWSFLSHTKHLSYYVMSEYTSQSYDECTLYNASNIWIDLYNGPPSKGDQDILHILHLSLNIPHHTPENIFLQSFCNRELKYTTFCALSICWNYTERIKTGRHCNALETIFFGTLLLGYQLLSPWTQNQIQIQKFDPQ